VKILAKLDYKVLAGQSNLVMRVLNNLKYKPERISDLMCFDIITT